MTTAKHLLSFLFLTLVLGLAACEEETPEGDTISGDWNVTAWSENGVADTDVSSYGMIIAFSGNTMTISGSNIPFNYTGSYTLDANDNLTASLNETSGESEIEQFGFDVASTITSSSLALDGNLMKSSQFWSDTTVTVAITATR